MCAMGLYPLLLSPVFSAFLPLGDYRAVSTVRKGFLDSCTEGWLCLSPLLMWSAEAISQCNRITWLMGQRCAAHYSLFLSLITDCQWCGLSWGRGNKWASRGWPRPVFRSTSQCRNARKSCCRALYTSSDKVHTVQRTHGANTLYSHFPGEHFLHPYPICTQYTGANGQKHTHGCIPWLLYTGARHYSIDGREIMETWYETWFDQYQ